MTRYMADAIDCGQFTRSISVPGRGVQPVALRAGYVNGRWPTAVQCNTEVSIDVDGSRPDADVLDIEAGDATPDTAPGWVRAHNGGGHSGGFPAVLYCNRTAIHAVANACDGAGLQLGRDYRWWLATLDGTESVPDMTGVVAVQVWSANYFPGHDIDLSIVYDDAWKGSGSSTPTPTPTGGFLMDLTYDEQRRVLGAAENIAWLVTQMKGSTDEIHAWLRGGDPDKDNITLIWEMLKGGNPDGENNFNWLRDEVAKMLAGAVKQADPQTMAAALAPLLAKLLPAATAVSQTDLEAALRNVLGSLDNTKPTPSAS